MKTQHFSVTLTFDRTFYPKATGLSKITLVVSAFNQADALNRACATALEYADGKQLLASEVSVVSLSKA